MTRTGFPWFRRGGAFPAAMIVVSTILVLSFPARAEEGAEAEPEGPAERGRIWLERIDEAERAPHSHGFLAQTIFTAGGSERTLEAEAWSGEGGDLSLTAYTAPARVRGDKILIRDGGDNIWYYMRRRDVTRHFAGHARRQKAMGSDFSYEDMAAGDLGEDYEAEWVGFEEIDGERCVKLRLAPTPEGPSYDHLILWAAVSDRLSRRIDYYDDDGLLKTLSLGDFRVVDGRKTAFVLDMKNHREGSRTVIRTDRISFSEEPPPRLFTKESLTGGDR